MHCKSVASCIRDLKSAVLLDSKNYEGLIKVGAMREMI